MLHEYLCAVDKLRKERTQAWLTVVPGLKVRMLVMSQ